MKRDVSAEEAINVLCNAFVQFDWRVWKVAVSADRTISICKKASGGVNTILQPAAIMINDGKMNAASHDNGRI